MPDTPDGTATPDGTTTPKRVEGALRVVQLNIGSLLEPHWSTRRLEIVAWLDRLDADVVCLEEVRAGADHRSTAAWLAERTRVPYRVAVGVHQIDPVVWPDPAVRFGSAILSRWPIDQQCLYRLSIVDEAADLFARAIPWELLHARTAGIDVFATHLSAAPTHAPHRRRQVVEIDRLIRLARGDRDTPGPFGTRRPHPPAVLCGDFNAEPDSDEIRFLCSLTSLEGQTTFWQDAWRVAGDGPGYTQDWRTHPLAAGLNVNRKRIDYVFVGDGFTREANGGRVLRAELAFDHSLTGIMASDHSGLVVDIAWPPITAAPAVDI